MKMTFIIIGIALAVIGLTLVVLPFALRGPEATEVTVYRNEAAAPAAVVDEAGTLTVVTVNGAHGRGTSFFQLFLSEETIRANLDAINAALVPHQPDVVAIQEIDAPSGWSGSFNHVHYLADGGGYGHAVQGEHVSGLTLSYGTAVLSRHPIEEARSYTFKPTPPGLTKGFVLAREKLPGWERDVDVVSVHFDFLNAGVRKRQAENIVELLRSRGNHTVIMGDFNCEWTDDNSTARLLVDQLGLAAYEPEADNLATFPLWKKRLDWILISPELDFERHEVLPDSVSDHKAVLATIRLANSS